MGNASPPRRSRRLRSTLGAMPAIGLLLIGPGTARASCATTPDPATAIGQAPVAFVGRVTTVGDYNPLAVFTVEEIWKGTNLPPSVTVLGTGPSRAPAVNGWVAGERYLVFPVADASGDLHEEECSPTSVYQPAFDQLRPANAHPPQGPPTSGVPGSAPIAAVFLAILVVGSAGAFLLFRSGSRRS